MQFTETKLFNCKLHSLNFLNAVGNVHSGYTYWLFSNNYNRVLRKLVETDFTSTYSSCESDTQFTRSVSKFSSAVQRFENGRVEMFYPLWPRRARAYRFATGSSLAGLRANLTDVLFLALNFYLIRYLHPIINRNHTKWTGSVISHIFL